MPNLFAKISAEITKELQHKLQPLIQFYEQTLHKFGNPAQASFELGCELMQRGLYKEALYRFKFTLWRNPQRASAWYNSALCHFALEETALGIAALKHSLNLNPKNEAALFLLATVDNGKYAENHQPHTTPPEIVKSEFAARAETFEIDELGGFGYVGHFSIFETMLALLTGQENEGHWLDAGCGTGLLGELVRPLCQQLTGIDLSLEMLAKARTQKNSHGVKIYDHLLEGDLRAHLLHQPSPLYRCILASNVAPIMGGLAPMIDGAARALHAGGWFVFNVLPSPAQEGYLLLPQEQRFAHSEDYLQQLAQKAGLRWHSLALKPFYNNRNAWVVVMQKDA